MPMISRWLTLVSALTLGLALAGTASAKPPEEEAVERAERAAERAAKAAERAAEAAERASERELRERDSGGRGTSSGYDQDRSDIKLASASGSGHDETEAGSPGEAPDTEEEGSSSGSNSGSGSGSDDEPDDFDDNSGHGSGDDDESDEDEDDRDDDDDQDNRQGVIVPVENDDAGNPYREGELVIMSDDASLIARAEALGFGVIETRELVSIGTLVARLRRPEGVSSSDALELLREREPASPSGFNYVYRAAGEAPHLPDDEQRSAAPDAASVETRVGVIDGFSTNAVGEWPVERLVGRPALKGHGDVVTGILLRDLSNAFSIKPDQLMLLDVMEQHGSNGAADVAALVIAFDRLVTARIDFANLSLAGPDHPALRRAVQHSLKAGMVIVAAVGNEGPAAPPAFPAAYDGVVGVSAVAAGAPYLYSGRGPHVDIAALGTEVSPSGSGGELVGTSYAAPRVTAALAGLRRANRAATIDTLLSAAVEDAGAPGRDPVYGLGILTLSPEVSLAQSGDGNRH
ncbi:MAG: hypothetical protein RIR33_1181 [Pseudomonadota bacterium]|jgi:Subtilase family